MLVKAGALILAEIERLDRAAAREEGNAAEDILRQIRSQFIENRGDMTDAEALSAIRHLCERGGVMAQAHEQELREKTDAAR